MFAVFCPYQEARVLLSPSNILDMERRDGAIAVRYRCWCGHEGWHTFARHAGRGEPVAAAPLPADLVAEPATPRSLAPTATAGRTAVPAPC
jgi:hypothetical protein